MIRPLRQRHRHMFTALGLLLPVALIVGVAARKAVPSVAALPAGLEASSQHFTSTEWVRDDLFRKTSIQARLLREPSAGRFAVLGWPEGRFCEAGFNRLLGRGSCGAIPTDMPDGSDCWGFQRGRIDAARRNTQRTKAR